MGKVLKLRAPCHKPTKSFKVETAYTRKQNKQTVEDEVADIFRDLIVDDSEMDEVADMFSD
jgi:hypothetical protein